MTEVFQQRPISTTKQPDGTTTSWFSGEHVREEFPGAIDVAIISGLTGTETQVTEGFRPRAVVEVKVIDEDVEYPVGSQAAD